MTQQIKNTGIYPILLAATGAIGGFLFGYDTAVISGTIPHVSEQFSLNELQTGWYVGCALLGSILGVLVVGILSDRLGRRLSLWLAAVLFTISSAGCMVVENFDALVIYRIIGGMGIGVASVVSPLYISEVSPPRMRGRLVTLYQLAITIGIVASYIVNARVLVWSNSDAYFHEWLPLYLIQEPWRMMLGLETIPALLFFLLLFFIPESPHWLVAQKKISAAERTLTRLFGRQTAKKQLQETLDTLATQKDVSWRILLSPVYRTPMVIGVCLAILGQFMGVNAIFYYGPTIFQQAGAGSQGALDFQIIVGIVNVLSTILAMYLVDKIGRKKLVYVGVGGMLFILVGISIFFMSGMNNPEILLLMILLYIFFAAISICVVIWVLLSEMYPLKVRGFAMSCAGFSLWIGTYLIGQVTPVLLGGIGAAWTFGLFALMCLPYLAITYYLVPETTGKTLEEIERIWQKKAEKNDRAPFS